MNQLIEHDGITQIVSARDAAVSKAWQAAELMTRAHQIMHEANTLAVQAHGGSQVILSDAKRGQSQALNNNFETFRSLAAWVHQLDAQVWMNVNTRTGMSHMLSAAAKEKFYKGLQASAPNVDEQTVRDTVAAIFEQRREYLREGIATAFSQLDPRFKSHDSFKFKHRIILSDVFGPFGSWNYSRKRDDMLRDVERCFAVLAGVEPDFKEFTESIDKARAGWGPKQGDCDTRFFRVRTYKNGNMHLWVKDQSLLDKVNQELAAYYGAVLPDAVPRNANDRDLKSKAGALSKDLAFYFTPAAAARKALSGVDVSSRKVLEPSAGEGHLTRVLLDSGAQVHAVEVDPGRFAKLKEMSRRCPAMTVQYANFLQTTPSGDYDRVVMNPPFCGTHFVEHVAHAFEFLKPGGELVAILPATAQIRDTKKLRTFRDWAERNSARWYDMPLGSFKESGTMVSTVTLCLRRDW